MLSPRLLLLLALLAGAAGHRLCAQQVVALYPGAVPNARPNRVKEILVRQNGQPYSYQKVSQPTLTVYLPPQAGANGTAVVICPGGGYVAESYQQEGVAIAQEFVRHGTAAFVLKYRLPSDSTMQTKQLGPLQDAQQALKLVRQRAAEWRLRPDRVGLMGFSAGGHLAATAGTHFAEAVIANPEKVNLRPDFLVLIYPVISMSDQLAHAGSRQSLLGNNPTAAQVQQFSNELHVTDATPPTWLTHTGDDRVVDVDNSLVFYEALRHHHVPAEMHLYPAGDHGFVLKLAPEQWMQPLFGWMNANGWLTR